jgi:hypothetical protein
MTFDEFRALLAAEPFRPFRVKYRTGEVYDVATPDDAWVPPSKTPSCIYVAAPAGMSGHLDPSWIVGIEYYRPRGAARRRKAG